MLVAVPYALRAADAEKLGGQPASSYVRSRADGKLETSGGIVVAEPAIEGSGIAGQIAKFTGGETLSSSVISESASNRIGFGLTDPTGGGVVDSVFTIRNFDNNTGFGILNQSQQRQICDQHARYWWLDDLRRRLQYLESRARFRPTAASALAPRRWITSS